MGLSLVCFGTYVQQDILILKIFTDDEQIGLFSSGYRIILAMVVFTNTAIAVLLPELSRKASQSASEVSALSGKIAYWFSTAAIPGVVVLALVAKPLLVFLYGQPFAAAAPVLQFLAVAVFLVSLEYLFTMGLIALNRSWWISIAAASGLVVNVALNLLWIPKSGFLGAVHAKLVAEIVLFCMYFGLFQLATRGPVFPKWLIKPLSAGIILILVLVVSMPLGIVPALLISIIAYVLSIMTVGIFRV